MLNMADLMIEYDREEKYETTDKGKQLMLQSTKACLVRKNDS
jgi:predicted transcriptional regulator